MKKISNTLDSLIVIDWMINSICNYRCSYCSEKFYAGKDQIISNEDYLHYFKLIDDEFPDNPKKLIISGGEPTLHKGLIDIIETFNDKWHIQILTNGARKLHWWETFCNRLQNKNVKLIISFHPEFADPTHVIQVSELTSNFFNTTIQILFQPSNKEKIDKMIELAKQSDKNINLKIKPLRNIYNENVSIDYTKNEIEFMEKNSFVRTAEIKRIDIIIDGEIYHNKKINSLISEKQNNFKDWKCFLGSKRFLIWADGTITGSTCGTGHKHILGEIKDKKIKMLNGVTCEDSYCGCVEDILIPKIDER